MGLYFGLETKYTLAISGDLEVYLHGSRRTIGGYRTPSVGCVYDHLAQQILRFRRINIRLEIICINTATNFLYALACFLNRAGARTEELHINVAQGRNLRCDSEDLVQMWYSITKLPADLQVFITGDLERRSELELLLGTKSPWVEAHVQGKFLRNNRPNPARPSSTNFNAIAEFRRIMPIARPLIEAARQELKTGWVEPHMSILAQDLDRKMREYENCIERGEDGWWAAQYREKEMKMKLEMCGEWMIGRTSAELYGWYQEDELEKVYHEKLRALDDEHKKWDEETRYRELKRLLWGN